MAFNFASNGDRGHERGENQYYMYLAYKIKFTCCVKNTDLNYDTWWFQTFVSFRPSFLWLYHLRNLTHSTELYHFLRGSYLVMLWQCSQYKYAEATIIQQREKQEIEASAQHNYWLLWHFWPTTMPPIRMCLRTTIVDQRWQQTERWTPRRVFFFIFQRRDGSRHGPWGDGGVANHLQLVWRRWRRVHNLWGETGLENLEPKLGEIFIKGVDGDEIII